MCRGDHWSPVNLPQQRIFRDSFLQGKRARASNARPYKSFSTAWKNPTTRKQLDISIKRTLKIGHCLCRFCAIQQRKKAAATSLPQLFVWVWQKRYPVLLLFWLQNSWYTSNLPFFVLYSAFRFLIAFVEFQFSEVHVSLVLASKTNLQCHVHSLYLQHAFLHSIIFFSIRTIGNKL